MDKCWIDRQTDKQKQFCNKLNFLTSLFKYSTELYMGFSHHKSRENDNLGRPKVIFDCSLEVSCLLCDDFSILKQSRSDYIKHSN